MDGLSLHFRPGIFGVEDLLYGSGKKFGKYLLRESEIFTNFVVHFPFFLFMGVFS